MAVDRFPLRENSGPWEAHKVPILLLGLGESLPPVDRSTFPSLVRRSPQNMLNRVVCTVLALASWAVASPLLDARQAGISDSVYDDLVRYTQYSSAAYQLLCLRPLGNTLVDQFSTLGTEGFIARDDDREEIVVSFRGSLSPVDALTDIQIIRTTLNTPGVANVGDASVHIGFLNAYNLVARDVLAVVQNQTARHPKYKLVVTGHSLGGALAAIGAISLQAAHPTVPIKLYTFGQPRTGNAAFAALVEQRIGVNNIFRAVHTFDGVPTILFQALGYKHFGTEYWNFQEPACADNTKKCSGPEDPKCSDSIPSTGINLAHLSYFGQLMALNPLLCV
ncbi:alpha/beta-hydrolase [Pluteus cervinus]|uniref:Alpha/beta-hydrolase n=1 Tax=Pluteus cervinus TaxID=181527 RepID=A0ACD3B8W6_9AGAR|nr:alpha/beta-hydrolase [Pluteus cervinus]